MQCSICGYGPCELGTCDVPLTGKSQAFCDGFNDALSGRVFRHSAQPGSYNRAHLDDYDKGWTEGRASK